MEESMKVSETMDQKTQSVNQEVPVKAMEAATIHPIQEKSVSFSEAIVVEEIAPPDDLAYDSGPRSMSEHDADDEEDDETSASDEESQPPKEASTKEDGVKAKKRVSIAAPARTNKGEGGSGSDSGGSKGKTKPTDEGSRRRRARKVRHMVRKESDGVESSEVAEGGGSKTGSSDGDESEEELEAKGKNPKIVAQSPTERYVRFNELLGEGSFKKVYRAYDTQQGVEVAWNAVKVSNLKKSAQQRIVQEMAILQKLNHPHIIKFFASWLMKATQSVVFITEMMSSGTLKDFIQNRPVRLRIAKRWCRHILHALIYLHEENQPAIIHRDLKCDNIFINGGTGDIRIGDLGLASWQRTGNAKSVLGTPEYMAPEMFEENYDEKVDIYAFGMCILEMITKETPYMECSSTPQIYKKVMEGVLPEAYHCIVECPVKKFIYACIRRPEEGKQRPCASELRGKAFLRKTGNDPQDDIDCKELLVDCDSELRIKRLDRKHSTTSLTYRDDSRADFERANTPSPTEHAGTKNSRRLSSFKEKAPGVLFANIGKEEVINQRAAGNLAPNSPIIRADRPSFHGETQNNVEIDSDHGGHDGVAKGLEVEARFGGDGDWFPGKIHNINDDGTYGIKYDDHDYEDSVSLNFIRITNDAGVKVPLHDYLSALRSGEQSESMPRLSLSSAELNRKASNRSLHSDQSSMRDETWEDKKQSPDEQQKGMAKTGSKRSLLQKTESNKSMAESVNSEGEGIPRWSMVAKSGEPNSSPSELMVLFSFHGGPSAMFPFNINKDQPSAVAAELVDTLSLPPTELDGIALELLQFRKEYETHMLTSPNQNFRSTVERVQNTRLSVGEVGTSVNKLDDDTEPALTDEEIAEYDRQIAKEQESYRQIQAKHMERIDAIKRRKEQRQIQQQRQTLSGAGTASQPETRSRAASDRPSESPPLQIPQPATVNTEVDSTTQVLKTKDQLRQEAAQKRKMEKEHIRRKQEKEREGLEAKISSMGDFSLGDPVKALPPVGVRVAPSAPSLGTGVKTSMTLNEVRHQHQLDALAQKAAAPLAGANQSYLLPKENGIAKSAPKPVNVQVPLGVSQPLGVPPQRSNMTSVVNNQTNGASSVSPQLNILIPQGQSTPAATTLANQTQASSATIQNTVNAVQPSLLVPPQQRTSLLPPQGPTTPMVAASASDQRQQHAFKTALQPPPPQGTIETNDNSRS